MGVTKKKLTENIGCGSFTCVDEDFHVDVDDRQSDNPEPIFRFPPELISYGAVEESKSRLRELWLLEVPAAQCGLDEDDPTWGHPCPLGAALNLLRETCRLNNVKVNV